MSNTNPLGEEVSVDEPTDEHSETGGERAPDLRPSVEQEIQAKVDTNHPDATLGGLTLEAEERLEAREWEIERTRVRFDRHETSDREARSRRAAAQGSRERRYAFGRRAASVDPWADPDAVDPREQLSRADLAVVNREAARLAPNLARWSRAAISRRLAERIVDGADVASAVVGVFEALKRAPGGVIPIAAVSEVRRREVSIAGTVTHLWEPSHPKIAQVGLLEDESGRIKFTAWVRSRQPVVAEGERVVFRDVSKNWYEGRVSVALTGWSDISFTERERWWTE